MEAEGQYLPACLALFLSARFQGCGDSAMLILLEGTPCCSALITEMLHVISGGKGEGGAFIRVSTLQEMHIPLMLTPFETAIK